eukprot:gene44141-34745_t
MAPEDPPLAPAPELAAPAAAGRMKVTMVRSAAMPPEPAAQRQTAVAHARTPRRVCGWNRLSLSPTTPADAAEPAAGAERGAAPAAAPPTFGGESATAAPPQQPQQQQPGEVPA